MAHKPTEEIVQDVLSRLARMSKRRFKDRSAEVQAELEAFRAIMRENLTKYTDALADGELTEAQFKELLGDDLRLMEMKGLTQAGISIVEVNKFKKAVMKLIIRVVLTQVVPLIL